MVRRNRVDINTFSSKSLSSTQRLSDARALYLEPKQIYIFNVNRVYGQNFTRIARNDFEYLKII